MQWLIAVTPSVVEERAGRLIPKAKRRAGDYQVELVKKYFATHIPTFFYWQEPGGFSHTHFSVRWGDYRKCDTPLRTIEAMYKHIAAHHSIDLIYWTGDLPPHDIWKQSRHGNVEVEPDLFYVQMG